MASKINNLLNNRKYFFDESQADVTSPMDICHDMDAYFHKLTCLEDGILQMEISMSNNCDTNFGGDTLVLQTGVCTSYAVAGKIFGIKVDWTDVTCDPATITYPQIPDCKPLVSALRE